MKTRFAAVLGVLLVLPAAPAQDRPPVPARRAGPIEEAASRYLEAFRAGAVPPRDAVAAEFDPDPYRVAAELLVRHAEGSLKDPPEPGEFLAAAEDLARRAATLPAKDGLPRLVEAWRGLDREGLLRERRLQAAVRDVGRALGGAEGPAAALRLLGPFAADRSAAPWSVAAVDLDVLEAKSLRFAGRLRDAQDPCRRALGRCADMDWPAGPLAFAGALSEAAALRRLLGDLRGALALYEEQAAQCRSWGWKRAEHGSLGNTGIVLAQLGEFAASDDAYERARRYFEETGDAWSAALFRTNGLINLARTGRTEEAVAGLEAMLKETEERKDRIRTAQVLENLGVVHLRVGRVAPALFRLEQALERRRALEDRGLLARTLGYLGEAWERAGDPERALAMQREALREQEAIGNAYQRAAAEAGVARALGSLGRFAEARECYGRARTIAERLGCAAELQDHRLGDAEACLGLGRAEEALGLFEAIRKDAAARGDGTQSGSAEAGIARALEDLGRVREAAAAYERAFAAAEERGHLTAAAEAAAGRGRLDLLAGRPGSALDRARTALDRRLREGASLGESGARRIREGAAAAVDMGLEACVALSADGVADGPGIAAAALGLVEAGRAATLLEDLSLREVILRSAAGPELATRDLAARHRVQAARSVLASLPSVGASKEDEQRARSEIDAAYRALEDVEGAIRRAAGAAAGAGDRRPATEKEIRAALPEGTVLLVYRAGRGRGTSPGRASVIAADAAGTSFTDLGPSAPLLAAVEAYLSHAATAGSRERDQAAALFESLLRPVAPHLRGARRLLVSCDGSLATLPFEALVDAADGNTLRAVERWEFAYAPSGTVFAALAAEDRGRPPGEGIVALGDPAYPAAAVAAKAAPAGPVWRGEMTGLRRLESSADEARSAAARFPEGRRTVLLGERAGVDDLSAALRAAGGRLAVVHLACHGVLDARRPLVSGLALAGGRVLTVHDVHRMRVPADLAVLSACETGRGADAGEEGLVGLVRAFLFAGCPRVVVSNWRVEDAATRAFMEDFHRGLRADGLRPAAALRAAKLLRIRAGGEQAHPSRWAAFVLWGLPE